MSTNVRIQEDGSHLSANNKLSVPEFDLKDFEGASDNEEVRETYQEKFQRSIMDQLKEYPLPDPILSLSRNSQPTSLLTVKSFSLWQGKQKSRKTTALALAVASFIRPLRKSDQSIEFVGSMNGTVLFFDNEQGENYAARTMKLVLKLAGVESSSNLIYCDLREFLPHERMKIIEAGIMSTENVKLVVIDGLVDLMTDFMDPAEGHLIATQIIKLCSQYDIHVAGVLHQNKNDKNARAHIGTISSQKCEVEIATEIDPDDKYQSLVECVNSRGLPFEKFAIRWEPGALPCINQDWSAEKASDAKSYKNFQRSKEIAEALFKPLSALSHTEAIQGIMNAELVSESTAKRRIRDYIGWNFINKGQDGKYRINITQGSKVQEGSNEVHEPVQ